MRGMNFLEVVADAADLPVLNIERNVRIAPGYYSVVLSSVDVGRDYRFSDYNASIARMLDEKFGVVANSLFSISTSHVPMYRAIIAANAESKPYSEEAVKGMTAVQANVFQDSDDNLWKLVGTGNDRRIVQVGNEDFDALLAAKQSRQAITASYSAHVEYDDGDYVAFFNPITASIDYGFLTVRANGQHYVLPRASSQETKIIPDQVVEAAAVHSVEIEKGKVMQGPAQWRQNAIEAGNYGAKAYLDYTRTLYGGTAFFKRLEEAIRHNGVV